MLVRKRKCFRWNAWRAAIWRAPHSRSIKRKGASATSLFPPGLAMETGCRADFHARDQGRDRSRCECAVRYVVNTFGLELPASPRPNARHLFASRRLRAPARNHIGRHEIEFGFVAGELVLADEVLTPDSSRFWEAASHRPGGPQLSFDKQYVRDYLESSGWKQTSTGARSAGRGSFAGQAKNTSTLCEAHRRAAFRGGTACLTGLY